MRLIPLAAKATTLCLGLALCALITPQYSSAQLSSAAPRVAGPIDDTSLSTVSGSVPGFARPAFDRGQASPSTVMTHVRLVFSRSAEQQADLDNLLAAQIDPASPSYHQWITPQEFGHRFGPADSDIAAITAWLQSHGLKVDPIPPGRTDIAFSGTVTQLEEAFHISIHNFDRNGDQFLSNTADPRVPSAIAPLIAGIGRLNTIQPRPSSKLAGMGAWDPSTHSLSPVKGSADQITPELTTGTSPDYFLYVVPADAATIYNTPNSFNANFSSGTSYTGSGVKIGIGGDAVILPATVADYRTRFLGDSTQPAVVNVDGVVSKADAAEAYIDTELAGGLAPGATITFYTSTDLFSAVQQALTDNKVDIFSISFGECEKNLASFNASINTYASQAATQGITMTVSTGDSGSAGCDNDNTQQTATLGLQVNGLASTPYNIAVGGTDYSSLLNGGFTTYVNVADAGNYGTAKSYIPERPWNDSTTLDGQLSANVPYVKPSTSKTNIIAGGGGKSSCTTATLAGCTGGYPKPSWQRGTGVPADSARDIPDVSLLAGNGFDAAAWLVCTDGTGTVGGVLVTADCTKQSDGQFYFFGFGGTSTSAPAFAGILALVEQKTGGRLGTGALKTLYDLYNGPHAAAIFHDIAQGNNSVTCLTGTPNCTMNTAGNLFLTGYNATAGYDLATGIGSVDATQLINFWGSSSTTATPTVTAVATPTTITTNQALSVLVTVTGTAGTPTGNVTLTSGSSFTNGPHALTASGTYTFDIPAGSLPVGSHTLNISYAGDAKYSAASTTATVTVTGLPSAVALTASASAIVSNQSMTVKATVTGSGPTPTGTVTLAGGGYTSPTPAPALSGGVYTFTIPANSLAAGSDSLKVTYSGDNVYATSNASVAVTVTQFVAPTATVTATPALATLVSSQALSVPVKVTGTGPLPTGSVTLTSGTYTSSPASLIAGAATITIPANTLGVGTASLKVTYSGDGNYATVNSTATVTVNAPYTMKASAPTAVTRGSTATSTITVTSDASYTGSLALTCALTTSPAGATDSPACSVTSGAAITVTAGTPSPATATVSITSTAAQASLQPHGIPGWMRTGGGAVLALLVFLGIPARRRGWRNIVGLLALFAAFASLSACGGGSGGSGTKDPGTSAGAYVFTVTATGNPAVTPAPTLTINVTIN